MLDGQKCLLPTYASVRGRHHSYEDQKVVNISHVTCINWSAWFNNNQECFGCGLDIGGNVVQVMRCCGNRRWSRTYGMFIFVIASGQLKHFPSSDKP
jgi:hypothetical protein